MTGSTSQPLSDICMFCREPLRITIDPLDGDEYDSESEHPLEVEGGQPSTILDDVELYCGPPGSGPGGHHAHWTCLIDHAKQEHTHTPVSGSGASSALSLLSTCALCGQNTLDPSGRLFVDVRNEGGETRGFDFGVILDEELYLDSHPTQIHARAFHDLVAQGEYTGAIELMQKHDVDVNCTYGSDGLTVFQKAMFSGDTSGVEFLRGLGATM